MTFNPLRNLKAFFSVNGAVTVNETVALEGTRYYSASERESIRQHRRVAQAKAREAIKAAGVTIDPRIAKARAPLA